MYIRPATEADLPALEELYRAFDDEIPPPWYVDHDIESELREVAEYIREHVALVSEEDGELIGLALARMKQTRRGYLSDLYVRSDVRRSGVARALVHEVAKRLRERGAEVMELNVMESNTDARAVYTRWGFTIWDLRMVASMDDLETRLADGES